MKSYIENNSYDGLASEYYDADRHPTCSNFRQLSEKYIRRVFRKSKIRSRLNGPVIETGAGKTTIVPILEELGFSLRDVILQDISERMLAHSVNWHNTVNKLIVSDARNMPIGELSVDVVVGTLADPYNDSSYWRELARIVRRSGVVVLTLPSKQWANGFREQSDKNWAEFLTTDLKSIYVPSFTYSPNELVVNMRRHGFLLLDYEAFFSDDIEGITSPKLNFDSNDHSVLDGFVFIKK